MKPWRWPAFLLHFLCALIYLALDGITCGPAWRAAGLWSRKSTFDADTVERPRPRRAGQPAAPAAPPRGAEPPAADGATLSRTESGRALARLVAMGFAAREAAVALHATGGDVTAAAELLLAAADVDTGATPTPAEAAATRLFGEVEPAFETVHAEAADAPDMKRGEQEGTAGDDAGMGDATPTGDTATAVEAARESLAPPLRAAAQVVRSQLGFLRTMLGRDEDDARGEAGAAVTQP
jgi:hypothetical protein